MDKFTSQLLGHHEDPKNEPAPATTTAKPLRALPPHESGWATLFNILAFLGVGAAGIGVLIAQDGRNQSEGLTLVIVGIVSAVQSLFISFLIKLLTHIRWYLAKLTQLQEERQ